MFYIITSISTTVTLTQCLTNLLEQCYTQIYILNMSIIRSVQIAFRYYRGVCRMLQKFLKGERIVLRQGPHQNTNFDF